MSRAPRPAGERRTWRDHAFRYAAVLAGFTVGLLVLFAITAILDHRQVTLTGAILVLLIVLAISVVVTLPGYIIGNTIGQRYVVGDRTEVALQPAGQRWRHGRLTISSTGALTFQPYRWQVRIPAGPPFELTDPHLGPDTGRRPPLRRIWSLNPQMRVMDLTTDEDTYLVAMLPSRIDLLRRKLDPTRSTEDR